MTTDTITFYRTRRLMNGRKEWRWRYQAAGNGAKLGHGGESYQKFEDCVKAVERITNLSIGMTEPESLINLVVYREDGSNVLVTVK